MLQQTVNLGRSGVFKKVWAVESKKVPAQYQDVVQVVASTNESSIVEKQLAGLTYADQTNEGETIHYDDWSPLFSRVSKPAKFTKGLRFSVEFDYTNQYNAVIDKQPALVRAFMHQRNRYAAQLHNLGFTDTTMGMNNEVLYSTAHSMGAGNPTGSNRPAIDLALSPLAIEQGMAELRGQKSARGTPMPVVGGLVLLVPPQLEPAATRYVNSMQLAGGNFNDKNDFIRNRIEVRVCDYFTSPTAWFLFAKEVGPDDGALVFLKGIPYTVEKLAMTDNLMNPWAAYETYTTYWREWRSTWGTVGA